jgi:PAS domain S-box-containing protein
MSDSPSPFGLLEATHYRQVFDRVQDIVYVRDLDGVILDINEAGARFFGKAKSALIGRTLHSAMDDGASRSLRATNDLLMLNGVDRSTCELPNGAGRLRMLETTTSMMFDDAGRPAGAYGVMRDVTESTELQRSLAGANEELTRMTGLLARDNDRKTRELEEARLVQLALLPQQVPHLANLDIAVGMRTASEVGGDYYDFSVHDDGSLTVAFGDVVGHGFKAGIYGATAKSYFQTLSRKAAPREIVTTMSEAFRNLGIPSCYMCLMLVSIREHEASFLGAGMPAFYVSRGDEPIERIEVAGTPLGSQRHPSFDERTVDFTPGTTMLLFSDGLAEVFAPEDEEAGELIIEACFATVKDAPPETIVSTILALADQRSGGRSPEDDVTVMVIRAR